ncbi:STM4015 family protein [Streptomyces uncialis]|uniref:STM4015 family protein n=1 Tax=Streptomyces uncialis TaxID=1048205 RepID=UPI00386C02AD|nr:STM4015 family protein [Streptomyces uncialis]
MITNHHEQHFGLPPFDFPRHGAEIPAELPDPASVAWRIVVDSYDSEESWPEAFARFRGAVDIGRVRALVVGSWSDPYENGPQDVIETLCSVREEMPELRSLFLGDISSEECEISWIIQGSVAPLLEAFPQLTEFIVRGGTSLDFAPVRHESLRKLVIESGGLPREVVRGVAESDFPALECLDLWLGTAEYGGDAELSHLAPILAGTRLPALWALSLRNSQIQDEIAAATAMAPVVARLKVLDMSMGTLGNEGAAALLSGQPLTHLKVLDLNHNYLSEEMRDRLRKALEPAGVELDLDGDDVEEDDEDDEVWRYVAVSE